jgi:hypothetical protein
VRSNHIPIEAAEDESICYGCISIKFYNFDLLAFFDAIACKRVSRDTTRG